MTVDLYMGYILMFVSMTLMQGHSGSVDEKNYPYMKVIGTKLATTEGYFLHDEATRSLSLSLMMMMMMMMMIIIIIIII